MKKMMLLLTCLIVTSLPGTTTEQETTEIQRLESKISKLQAGMKNQQKRLARASKMIKQLEEELALEKQQNRKLQLKCQQLGADIEPMPQGSEPDLIIYRGKRRTQKWLDGMYEKFYDKIIYWDGKYTDFGKHLAGFHNLDFSHMVWPIGTPVQFPYDSTVLSVPGNGEVLISNGYKYGKNLILHIHGLEGNFVVGQDFPKNIQLRLIYTGIFEYTAANQRHMTVPSLAPHQRLTKKQFAEAINNGVELVEYEKVIKDNRGRIYKRSDYDISTYLDGTMTIKKGRHTVRKLPKGKYNYEVIGKSIR